MFSAYCLDTTVDHQLKEKLPDGLLANYERNTSKRRGISQSLTKEVVEVEAFYMVVVSRTESPQIREYWGRSRDYGVEA